MDAMHAATGRPRPTEMGHGARRLRWTLARRAALAVATLLLGSLALAGPADAYVYWATLPPKAFVPSPGIGRANLDGTGVIQGFLPPQTPVLGTLDVAVDSAHVYWTNVSSNGAIGRANLDGTGVDQSFITAGTATGRGVAVDGAHVYWTNVSSNGAIGRANLDGTGVDQSFITGTAATGSLAVDGAHIFWADSEGGTIGRANLDGTGINRSFIAGASAAAVAVNGAYVYWTGGAGIGRANLDGAGVDPSFISVTTTGAALAVDGSHIYWGGDEGIGRANLDGTGVTERLIATDAAGLAVDALGPPPSNAFGLGSVKANKKRGSATLTVKVAGPGELKLAKTASVKGAHERAEQSGKEKLAIKPRGNAKKRLKQGGKAKVKAKVTYAPDGGTAAAKSKKIKLVKR